MALPKNPKVDLKRKYKRTLEFSFIITITFLIMAFKYFPDYTPSTLTDDKTTKWIDLEDVLVTKQNAAPPPPPKPQIPIEAPDDEILKDIPIEATSLDPNVDVPLPILHADDNETNMNDNVPFISVEQMPEPIGGIRSIMERLKYPEVAIRAGREGRVVVTVIVDESGNVESVELVEGIGMGCDEEAMKVIKETKFKPGKQRGRAVRVYVTIPIKFELN